MGLDSCGDAMLASIRSSNYSPMRPSLKRLGRRPAQSVALSHVSCCVGFRLPVCRPIPTLRRPAAEKRQGTKSREVGHRRSSEALFVRGARLRKFEEWRPRMRAQLKRFGTIDAKEGI